MLAQARTRITIFAVPECAILILIHCSLLSNFPSAVCTFENMLFDVRRKQQSLSR